MYVDFRERRTARDEQGNPVRGEEGRPKLEWVKRDRPLVKLHHVFSSRADRGPATPLGPGCGAGVGGARAGRGADQGQRHPGRPRGRRPSQLQRQGRPGGAAGPEPVGIFTRDPSTSRLNRPSAGCVTLK